MHASVARGAPHTTLSLGDNSRARSPVLYACPATMSLLPDDAAFDDSTPDLLLDAPAAPQPAPTDDSTANPRKRALDDKKEREKKRAQRNRELARMSNERRKNRIKAMESELEETKKTVTSLEESIRALEAENNGLKSLLEAKPNAAPAAVKQ